MRHVRTGRIAASVIVIGLAGCAHDAQESIDAPSIERVTGVEVWIDAPAGCEDVRVDALEWTLAEGASELVVLLDREERAVCVDTFDRVLAQLDQAPSAPMHRPLLGAPGRTQSTSVATNAGDPEPEPMHQPRGVSAFAGGTRAGDPEPEPMVQPAGFTVARGGTRAGDPEPEPMRGPSPATSVDLDP